MFRILWHCVTLLIATTFPFAAAGAAPYAYITNTFANTVSVVDTASNSVVGPPISVGTNPEGIAINPSGTRAYVANNGSRNVSVIDTSNNSVIATIPVGNYPEGIVVSPDGTRVYVANSTSSGSVSVIDSASNAVIGASIAVGSYPFGLAVSPDGTRVYVANNGGTTISVIDTSSKTVVDTITAGTSHHGIALSPSGDRIYVASHSDILVIDTATKQIVGTINVGLWPYGIAVNPAGTRVYAANYDKGTVVVMDTTSNTLIGAPIVVGHYPAGIAVNSAGTRVYVANQGSNSISIIDTTTNTVSGSTIAVGNGPVAFGQFIGPEPPELTLAVTSPTSLVSQTIGGKVKAGAIVTVSLRGDSGQSASVAGTSWSFNVTDLVRGDNSITVSASDSGGYTATKSATINCTAPQLAVTVNGTGGGTVTSDPGGISCTSGQCSALFDGLSTVALIPTPDGNSLFSGWTGACNSLSGNCTITMGNDSSTGDKGAGAAFTYVLPARVLGGGDYPHLRDAYATLTGDGTILARQFLFESDLNLDMAFTFFLKGGYDTAYAANNGYSTIVGTLTVEKGSNTVERVIIK